MREEENVVELERNTSGERRTRELLSVCTSSTFWVSLAQESGLWHGPVCVTVALFLTPGWEAWSSTCVLTWSPILHISAFHSCLSAPTGSPQSLSDAQDFRVSHWIYLSLLGVSFVSAAFLLVSRVIFSDIFIYIILGLCSPHPSAHAHTQTHTQTHTSWCLEKENGFIFCWTLAYSYHNK